MSDLLKEYSIKVVGVSFENDDGSNRQDIISKLGIGEALLLKFFEHNDEPAYSVTDAVGNQIGNLPKELSKELYEKYNDCYFVVQVDDILGGYDGLKYGCLISISVYDDAPEIFSPNYESSPVPAPIKKEYSNRTYNICGIFLVIGGIALLLMGFLLLMVSLVFGFLAIIGGICSFIIGKKYRRISKEHSSK